ncbi:MAG TPA: hypothetical protein VF103_13455 [Polyangiaceae bacterium]
MNRALWATVLTTLGAVMACGGGKLDAFTKAPAGLSGTTFVAGFGGTSSGGTSGDTAGGEGGDATPDRLLIDDFEDGDSFALLNHGAWFVSNDGSGVQTLAVAMPAAARPNSTFSIHTSGTGFADFGAVVCDVAGDAASFDVSAYAALEFYARAEAGSADNILFAFLVGSQHFAVPLRFGTQWERKTIRFSDVLPSETGPITTFDPRAVAALQFIGPKQASFDFWLDDLAFVR